MSLIVSGFFVDVTSGEIDWPFCTIKEYTLCSKKKRKKKKRKEHTHNYVYLGSVFSFLLGLNLLGQAHILSDQKFLSRTSPSISILWAVGLTGHGVFGFGPRQEWDNRQNWLWLMGPTMDIPIPCVLKYYPMLCSIIGMLLLIFSLWETSETPQISD